MSTHARRWLVNALTFSRVPLIFAFLVVAVFAERSAQSVVLPAVALALMFFAGISDMFDGMLARKWKVVSKFGKLADPLMDKVFFIVSFPTLLWLIAVRGDNPFHAVLMLVFTVMYILRDQWVTFLRAVASTYHADVSAMWLGKVRTALSFPAAGYIYLYMAYYPMMSEAWAKGMLMSVYVVEFALIALNIYSCLVYTKVYWQYVKKSIEE